ncbi:UTRA domain-containing protein [Nocardia salmonicida]
MSRATGCRHAASRGRGCQANAYTHQLLPPRACRGPPLVDPTAGPAGRGGGFAVLTLQGYEPDHMTETISARMPTPEETKKLDLPSGEPVTILGRRTYTVDDV